MTLNEAAKILGEAGVPDALYDARQIFRELGGFSDGELISRCAETDSEQIAEAVQRRANREPLQYILGKAYFYRECYRVTEDCLIPRSDTELLVDYAVKHIPEGGRLLDLCAGSGCIALSTLNNTKGTYAVGVDISEGAIEIARENATRLGLSDRIELLRADAAAEAIDGEFFAVLSNPPYVTEAEYVSLEREIYFEPRSAFVGGEDGGDFYRAITPLYRDRIPKEGFIAYEIGCAQSELIASIALECDMSCEILRDLSGNPRVAVLRRG